MARVEWIEHRLLNWARWRLSQGSGPLGYASVNLEAAQTPTVRDPYAAAPVPTNAIEASETDAAVQRLEPIDIRRAVVQFYTGRGGIKDHARMLSCAESTVYARVEQAHHQLVAQFSAAHSRRLDERRRVHNLQASARP